MKFFFLLTFALFSCLYANHPQPYESIKVLPEDAFSGYFANSKEVDAIFREKDIRTVIEIGSWKGGGSTRYFGEHLRKQNGTLYAVDTWLGTSTQQCGQVHYDPHLSEVFQQFLSNMIHWDLTQIVIPIRMKSLEAARALNVQPDLIYIDGEHTTQAVYEDLTVWYPIAQQAVVCGDDWTWLTVQKAVRKFAKERHLTIEFSGNFWRLHEKAN